MGSGSRIVKYEVTEAGLARLKAMYEINPETLYVVADLAEQLGIGKVALRKARKSGLPVRYWGNRSFVLGRDLIQHIVEFGRLER